MKSAEAIAAYRDHAHESHTNVVKFGEMDADFVRVTFRPERLEIVSDLDRLPTGQFDLAIDDVSPTYDLTAAAFSKLFPLLRSGGLYMIEDWRPIGHPNKNERFLGELAVTLMKDMASGGKVGNIKALPNMLMITRR